VWNKPAQRGRLASLRGENSLRTAAYLRTSGRQRGCRDGLEKSGSVERKLQPGYNTGVVGPSRSSAGRARCSWVAWAVGHVTVEHSSARRRHPAVEGSSEWTFSRERYARSVTYRVFRKSTLQFVVNIYANFEPGCFLDLFAHLETRIFRVSVFNSQDNIT